MLFHIDQNQGGGMLVFESRIAYRFAVFNVTLPCIPFRQQHCIVTISGSVDSWPQRENPDESKD